MPREEMKSVERWGIFEVSLSGPSEGNPFLEVNLGARFRFKNKEISIEGFYDGNGIYKIRFMPDSEGEWSFITSSNCPQLDGIEGRFMKRQIRENVYCLFRRN
jgi:hypothetical protein